MKILLDKVKDFPEEEKQKYLDHEMRVRAIYVVDGQKKCMIVVSMTLCYLHDHHSSYTASVHIATTLDIAPCTV